MRAKLSEHMDAVIALNSEFVRCLGLPLYRLLGCDPGWHRPRRR